MKTSQLWKVKFTPEPHPGKNVPVEYSAFARTQRVVSDTVEDAIALVRSKHPMADFHKIRCVGEVWCSELGLMGIGTPEEELAFARESVGATGEEPIEDVIAGMAVPDFEEEEKEDTVTGLGYRISRDGGEVEISLAGTHLPPFRVFHQGLQLIARAERHLPAALGPVEDGYARSGGSPEGEQ